MNCKKGDLARVVPNLPEDEWARGHIARCVACLVSQEGVVGWELDPPLRHPSGAVLECASDEILRPLPGTGVTDSEVRELYAPTLPEVTSV